MPNIKIGADTTSLYPGQSEADWVEFADVTITATEVEGDTVKIQWDMDIGVE